MTSFSLKVCAGVIMAMLTFSGNVIAEEVAPQEKQSAGDIYDAHVKDLTDDQKAELAKLEADFMPTMEPDSVILSTAAKLQYCSDTSAEFRARDSEYAAAFIKWRDKVNEWQHTLWEPHLARRSQIDYVPQDVLANYYEYKGKLFLVLGAQLTQVAREAGGFEKVDCAGLGRQLLSGTKPTKWKLQPAQPPQNTSKTPE